VDTLRPTRIKEGIGTNNDTWLSETPCNNKSELTLDHGEEFVAMVTLTDPKNYLCVETQKEYFGGVCTTPGISTSPNGMFKKKYKPAAMKKKPIAIEQPANAEDNVLTEEEDWRMRILRRDERELTDPALNNESVERLNLPKDWSPISCLT
jgi:hypothetical protein